MLDAFIIDEIRRREQDRERSGPRLERPGQGDRPRDNHSGGSRDQGSGRGAIIIDRNSDDDDDEGCIVIEM